MANRKVSEKITSKKQKKGEEVKKNRVLITVNVIGSAGPIRLVVNEDALVIEIIEIALKTYAREQRLPILGSNSCNFLLYCANAAIDGALSPYESIGSHGGRIFVLSKKQSTQVPKKERKPEIIKQHQKGYHNSNNIGWRAWLRKSFSFNILPH